MFPLMRYFSLSSALAMTVFAVVLITAHQYLDVSAAITESQGRFSVVLIAGLAALYAALFFIVRRADRALRQQEQQRATSIQDLQRQINRYASEMEWANRELEEARRKLGQAERLSTLGHLAATISHEIRNPLSVIRTSAHVMRKKAAAAGLDLDRPLDRSLRAVGRCDDIVNDMLEYARSNELNKTVVDSSAYLNEILDEQTFPANINVIRELPAPGLDIAIDCDRFRRVIINLVTNAAEAIKEGGIENGEIVVSCLPENNDHTIRVANNGPAIPAEVLDRMYEPLYTTKSNGSGIGLPTVKKLVDQHGAELLVDTQDGVGTTWSIVLQPATSSSLDAADDCERAIAA
ncbi:MAG: sensor histidine kinase [Hyphomicrobiaceae bacterium]